MLTPAERAAEKKERDRVLSLGIWRGPIRNLVAQRASFRCECCGLFIAREGEVDHKIPRRDCAAKGIHPLDPANLQYLCQSCHSRKSNAERWAGHQKRPFQSGPNGKRAKVAGRNSFLAAAGILPGMAGMEGGP